MQNITALQLGAALAIIIALACAAGAHRLAKLARASGYDQGYDDARQAKLERIELLQGELEDLRGLAAELETARRLERDELIQDADRRIAIYARRSNPFTEADQQTLEKAAAQLELLSRTFQGFGSTHNATQASQTAQQTLNMAERLRAALHCATDTSNTRSVIVYGPQACGKTRNARAIADALGLKDIRDNWFHGTPIPRFDALVLTSDEPPFSIPQAVTALSFTEAMQLVESKRMGAAA